MFNLGDKVEYLGPEVSNSPQIGQVGEVVSIVGNRHIVVHFDDAKVRGSRGVGFWYTHNRSFQLIPSTVEERLMYRCKELSP